MRPIPTLITALLLIPLAAPLAAEAPANLALFDGNYPRAFFFRSCEGGPSRPGMTYEKWEADYDRLMGIIGKSLDEEVIGREALNPGWFTRFKRDNPRQVVLLHFNGNARDPRHGTEKYFPGHWIYRQAVAITADVPAENGETVIPVSDGSGRIAIWDELVGGTLNTPGWLGKPLGPAVRPAARTPDLLAGIGTPPGETLATRIGNAAAANGAVTITPAADGTFSIRNVPANGTDLLVLLTVSAEPRKSYPADMPRLLHIEVVSGGLQSLMTWVNNRPFPAAFYFRDIRSASIDLNFKIEGNEPVIIHQLTAHAHPDAIYRLFENGLVLANPSAKPYLFDLPTIAPDRKFSRIHGGPTQDPGTNNGQPIKESVTLAPLDAVFLRADHPSHGGL